MIHIINNLYLSDLENITLENIRTNDIKLIINLSQCQNNIHALVTTINIDIYDQPECNIYQYFNICDKIITTKNNIVVHCLKAVSRSPTIILAYLIKYQRMTLLNALLFLINKKKDIKLNIALIIFLSKNIYTKINIQIIRQKKICFNQNLSI